MLLQMVQVEFKKAVPKSLAEQGNIAEEKMWKQMLLSHFCHAETILTGANFPSWKQENVSESIQKYICFPGANFYGGPSSSLHFTP